MFLGETEETPQWVDKALDIGKTMLQIKQQADIQRINIARAEKGLPPLRVADIAPQVKVGMDTEQLNKVLAVGAGIAVLAVVAYLFTRRR